VKTRAMNGNCSNRAWPSHSKRWPAILRPQSAIVVLVRSVFAVAGRPLQPNGPVVRKTTWGDWRPTKSTDRTTICPERPSAVSIR